MGRREATGRARALGRGTLAALAAGMVFLAAAPEAGAVVSLPRLIDGPSGDLVGDVDAAMAEDGTGGVVYLKRTGGRSHVFASTFRNGVWGAPQRVDVGQDFDSSWPRIAAGLDGRLLVVWVQEFGVNSDRMYSATMDPGAEGFREPVPVDFNVGEATSTFPDIAMNRGGAAYLVYNVVTDTSPANPPGYLGIDVRLARYSNRLWSLVGSRIDRNSSIPMRIPTAANSPKVGIDVQGLGVATWLEPDDEFVDRVWARRIFGGQTGIPLRVSPASWEDVPLRGNVDAHALDVSGFGWAAAAFRQQPGQASALDAPRTMVAIMPDVFTIGADTFSPSLLADGGARGGLGPPSVGVNPEGLFLAGFGSGSATFASWGDEFGLFGAQQIDTGVSSVEGEVRVDFGESGAGVAAWRERRGNQGVLRVQERRADGVFESTTLSGPNGGLLGPPALGGSGLGDALVAWSQGSGTNRQLVAAAVDAPPDPFIVFVPRGWQRKRNIPIGWDPAPHAIGGVRYSVSVDDEPVLNDIRGLGALLSKRHVGNGRHKIEVFAVDDAGQETGSLRGRLRVDRSPPKVSLRRSGRSLSVAIVDGKGGGIRTASVTFGDGTRARPSARGASARAKHTFARGGTYVVAVTATDRAGNILKLRERVRVG